MFLLKQLLNQTKKDEEQPYHLTPYRAFTLSLISIIIFSIIYTILGYYGHYKHSDLFNCLYLSIILQSTIGLGSNIEINSPVLRAFIMLQALTALLFFVI
jgi:hypothetical protein